jgi:hypothetical protein
MRKKVISWLIKLFVICFVVYGFIYHTFVMFLILFTLIGGVYVIIKHGQKIFDKLKNIKKL